MSVYLYITYNLYKSWLEANTICSRMDCVAALKTTWNVGTALKQVIRLKEGFKYIVGPCNIHVHVVVVKQPSTPLTRVKS